MEQDGKRHKVAREGREGNEDMFECMMPRDLDAFIAEHIYGWQEYRVGKDGNGENECVILTEGGRLPDGYQLPPKGFLGRSFMCPRYAEDLAAAIALANKVELRFPDGIPTNAYAIALCAVNKWNRDKAPAAPIATR